MPKSPQTPQDEAPQSRKLVSSYAQASGHIGSGLQFTITIVLGLLAGWWLDGELSTSPLFLIVGTLGGSVAGFFYLYRSLTSAGDNSDETESGAKH